MTNNENPDTTTEITDPNDMALLQALRGATFGPDSTVTLPSGRVLNAQQVRELTANS